MAKDDKPQVAPKAAEPKAKPKAPATIYIGPGLSGHLPRYALFKGGELPAHIKELTEREGCSCLKDLIVPVAELSTAEARLATPGSIEAARYAQAAALNLKGAE